MKERFEAGCCGNCNAEITAANLVLWGDIAGRQAMDLCESCFTEAHMEEIRKAPDLAIRPVARNLKICSTCKKSKKLTAFPSSGKVYWQSRAGIPIVMLTRGICSECYANKALAKRKASRKSLHVKLSTLIAIYNEAREIWDLLDESPISTAIR
jgi:hypothetical protein